MSEYKVTVKDQLNATVTTLNLKIKHFRNFDGKNMSPLGGITVVVDVDTGMMFHSKCRNDESFCRKIGTLNCIQKLLHCKKYSKHSLLPFFNKNIYDVIFGENNMTIWIDSADPLKGVFWWVGDKGRIGSKLYSEKVL